MSLTYLPELPEGLHPFYSIWKVIPNNGDDYLVLISADTPMLFISGSMGYLLTKPFATNQWYDKIEQKWKEGKTYSKWAAITTGSYDKIKLIYSNFDIYGATGSGWDRPTQYIQYKKSPDANEINIDGGDMRNMQKGMVWNVGAAVSINPPEAPQICTFSSSNPDVCTVDETGKIVAVGEGECIITITSKM